MNENRMKELLRQADRAAGPPPVRTAGLAGRVRTLHARRQLVRRVVGGAIAAMVAVTIGMRVFTVEHLGRSITGPVPIIVEKANDKGSDAQAQIDQLRAQIKELRAEADAALAFVRRVNDLHQQEDRLAELRRASGGVDPLEDVRGQVEKAAFTTLYQADRMYRDLNLRESAAASYRRVISLFPDTPSAGIARQRLSEIESSKGDKL